MVKTSRLLLAVAMIGCTPAATPAGAPASAVAVAPVGADASVAVEPIATEAGAVVAAAPEGRPRGTSYCFSWVHLADSSIDCYPNSGECEKARITMKQGARDTTACEPARYTTCTSVARPPEHPEQEDHCFERTDECEKYRRFVLASAHTATACTKR